MTALNRVDVNYTFIDTCSKLVFMSEISTFLHRIWAVAKRESRILLEDAALQRHRAARPGSIAKMEFLVSG